MTRARLLSSIHDGMLAVLSSGYWLGDLGAISSRHHVLPSCLQAYMRELVEAEKTATALVKALKSDLATEKAQHDQQVGTSLAARPWAAVSVPTVDHSMQG